jgi:hypothetical protein
MATRGGGGGGGSGFSTITGAGCSGTATGGVGSASFVTTEEHPYRVRESSASRENLKSITIHVYLSTVAV